MRLRFYTREGNYGQTLRTRDGYEWRSYDHSRVDEWHHYAVTRSEAGQMRVWIDGQRLPTRLNRDSLAYAGVINSGSDESGQLQLFVGYEHWDIQAPRYVDQFRIVDGAEAYTTSFVPGCSNPLASCTSWL